MGTDLQKENAYGQSIHRAADALATDGNREQALEKLIEASELVPYDPVHWHCRGVNEFNTERYADAAISYQKAIDLQDLPDRRRFLADALARSGNPQDAVENYRLALDQNPDDGDTWFRLGRTLHELDEMSEARLAFEKAIDASADSASGYFVSGRSHTHLGRYREAINAFQRGLKIDENDLDMRLELSEALLFDGKFQKALDESDDAIKRGADLSHAQQHRAQALVKLSRFDDALDAYSKVQPQAGDFTTTSVERTSVLISADRLEQAQEELEIAVQNDKVSEMIWFNLGVTRYRLGDYRGAYSAYEEALALTPRSANLVRAASTALMKLGDFEKAQSLLQSAVAQDPTKLMLWCGLGEMHYQMKKFDASVRAYRKALEIESNHTEAQIGMAATYISMKKEQDALNLLDEIETDSSVDSLVEFNRGVALHRLGKTADAIKHWTTAGNGPHGLSEPRRLVEIASLRDRGRGAWMEHWFGPDSNLVRRLIGGLLSTLVGLTILRMTIQEMLSSAIPTEIEWLSTTQDWRVSSLLLLAPLTLLILPSLSKIKFGNVTVEPIVSDPTSPPTWSLPSEANHPMIMADTPSDTHLGH